MSKIADGEETRLAKKTSTNKRIATGFLWVSFFVLLGKIVGAGKEMAIAWRYGVSETVDAYVFVINILTWPISIWLAVLTVVLVPAMASLRIKDPKQVPLFVKEIFGLTISVAVSIGLIAWLTIPGLIEADWSGLTDAAVNETNEIARSLMILIPLGIISGLFSVFMLAEGRHSSSLLEAIPSLIILITLTYLNELVEKPLIWGTLTGAYIHLFTLSLILILKKEIKLPSIGFKSIAWQGFGGSIGIMLAGQILMSLSTLIDQFFAVGIGPGALSNLNYANKIIALVIGVGALAISRSTLPIFSETQAKDREAVQKLALSWAKWMFIVGTLTAMTFGIFAELIVQVLFERGEFTKNDTNRVSEIFLLSLAQIPFYAYGLTLANLIASQKRYKILLLSGITGIVTKVSSATILIPLLGINGLVLSTTLVYAATALLFYIFSNRK